MWKKFKDWWNNYCYHRWQYDHDSTYDFKRTCVKCGKEESGDN